MCRIESHALQAAESKDVIEREKQAEDKLLDSTEKMLMYALRRRGGNPTQVVIDKASRGKVRARIKERAAAACKP